MASRPRSGWTETVEPGIYRKHRVACRSTDDRVAGRLCTCPFALKVPGSAPGARRDVLFVGTVAAARRERRRLLAAGRLPEPRRVPTPADLAPSETLTDFCGRYLRSVNGILAAHTVATTEREYRLRVHPALGHLPLEDVTRERLELWIADLVAAGASRRIVIGAAAAIRVVLSKAVEWGRLEANPALGLRLPPRQSGAEQSVERVLDPSRLQALYDATSSVRLGSMFRAASEAGLRRGEVIGLRWPDVLLDQRRLNVRRSVSQGRRPGVGPVREEKETKGRNARKVAITAGFAALLDAWYGESVVGAGASAAGYVWPGRDGSPMNEGTPTQALRRVLASAGLVDASGRPLVTFHGLRHTAASLMLAGGVSLIVVSRQLGHSDPQVTASVYAHLLGDSQLDEAAAVFADLFPPRTEEPGDPRRTARQDRAGDASPL